MNFLRDVWKELKKTSWPTRKELTKYTITVIATVVVIGLFVFGVDTGVSYLVNLLINSGQR